jgi:hypothetical protein
MENSELDMNDFISFEFCEVARMYVYVFDCAKFYRYMENLETEFYAEAAKEEKRGFL